MNLAIDIGNTRVKAALFDEDRLIHQEALDTAWEEKILKTATNHSVQNVILSTVGELPSDEFIRQIRSNHFYLELSATTPLPIKNRYGSPNTLGKDRIAAVAGAWSKFSHQNSLVVDAGTCITYDVIDAAGNYLGGNISPGIDMRLKAMHTFTANLPMVPQGNINSWIGTHTEMALRNGGQLGAWMETAYFIEYCKSRFEQINVILTGGDADFFANQSKSKIFVHHNLVLEGLNQILNYNAKR